MPNFVIVLDDENKDGAAGFIYFFVTRYPEVHKFNCRRTDGDCTNNSIEKLFMATQYLLRTSGFMYLIIYELEWSMTIC